MGTRWNAYASKIKCQYYVLTWCLSIPLFSKMKCIYCSWTYHLHPKANGETISHCCCLLFHQCFGLCRWIVSVSLSPHLSQNNIITWKCTNKKKYFFFKSYHFSTRWPKGTNFFTYFFALNLFICAVVGSKWRKYVRLWFLQCKNQSL